jgi:hypothetical protein
MIFDETIDDNDGPAPGAEIVPDGENLCEVIAAKEWVSKEGDRSALIVTLQPCDIRYGAFDKWLDPAEARDRKAAKELREACGLPTGTDLNEGTLKGARVMVTTKAAVKNGEPVTDKNGRQRVWVNGIAAAPQWKQNGARAAAAQAKPVARTPHQKFKAEVAAAGGDDDDPPF